MANVSYDAPSAPVGVTLSDVRVHRTDELFDSPTSLRELTRTGMIIQASRPVAPGTPALFEVMVNEQLAATLPARAIHCRVVHEPAGPWYVATWEFLGDRRTCRQVDRLLRRNSWDAMSDDGIT